MKCLSILKAPYDACADPIWPAMWYYVVTRTENLLHTTTWLEHYDFTTDFDLCQSSDSPGDYGKDQTEIIRQKIHVWKRPDTYSMVLIASAEAELTY